MKKIFVDDKRNLDEAIKSGYICVQSYKNCIMLLSIYKKVEIIGDNIPANVLGSLAGTIDYEILCGVSDRVPRLYKHREGYFEIF